MMGRVRYPTRNYYGLLVIFLWIMAVAGNAVVFGVEKRVPSGKGMSARELIRLVHPADQAQLPALNQTYVCGSVPSGGKVRINGRPVSVHPEGGFLTMIDLKPGPVEIQVELEWKGKRYELTRTIQVAATPQLLPAKPLTIAAISPAVDQALWPGDEVTVVCSGSPGAEAYFGIEGVSGRIPLRESETMPGRYQGVYRIKADDRLRESAITVTLSDGGWGRVSQKAAGRLSLFPHEQAVWAEVMTEGTVLRAGPALGPSDFGGYLLFPPAGTRLQLTGQIGREYRVRLTATKTAWVTASHVRSLPPETPSGLAVTGTVGTQVVPGGTLIRLPLSGKQPFKVTSDRLGRYLELEVYGAFSNTDWMKYPSGGIIESLEWAQTDGETYCLRVETLPGSWWGYDVRYEGQELVVELRTPPAPVAGKSVLAGLTIALDAGHGAGTGAIGVTGLAEGDANLALAVKLGEKLSGLGARVIMTRPGAEDVAVAARPRIAWENRADLLLSLHNNSLGYGGNPFVRRGFGVYYFTPHSLELARAIHRAYRERFSADPQFKLPDDGLRYGNLALTRSPQMPAVLIESAYMIVPEEEAYLKQARFHEACAEAIIRGLEAYAKKRGPDEEQSSKARSDLRR